MILRLKRTLCIGALAFAATTGGATAFDRDALGVVVAACRLNTELLSSPAPCKMVDADTGALGGYAVLREPFAKERTILAALAPISGIEDPRLLQPNAPNFFADAWKQRGQFLDEAAATNPWHGFTLAINPQSARSQDRLHVHIACLLPKLQAALAQRTIAVNPKRFAALNFKLQGRTLWAMRVPGSDLQDLNPLQLLAAKMPGARQAMGKHLLMVVAERMPSGAPTFVLLTNNPDNPANGVFSVEQFLTAEC